MKPIGILAVQGAFAEHENRLDELYVPWIEIRQRKDLDGPLRGIILPGGESTVMGKLLQDLGLLQPLHDRIQQGLPVFGTCAGLILLAKTISGGESPHLHTMDIAVKRNAYGRQLGSFHTWSDFAGLGNVPMTFIRAPYIEQVFGEAQPLATVNGHIVAARQKNQLVTSFHPELDSDQRVHRYFLDQIVNANGD